MSNITRDQHKFLSFAADQIRKAQLEWGIPHSFIKSMANNEKYRMGDEANEFQEGLDKIHCDARRAIVSYIDELTDAIRNIRRSQRDREHYQPVADHGTKGGYIASRVLDIAFARSSFDVSIRKKPEFELGFENDGEGYWKKVYVTLSCAWNKTVMERGIPIIRSSSGLRFVYSAKIKQFDHINDEMTTVFSVKTFGVKNKEAFADDGWLMVYGQASKEKPVFDFTSSDTPSATNNVHAFHRTLGDCKALFDRRVKAHVLKELEGI
jgi:hypothetical protein